MIFASYPRSCRDSISTRQAACLRTGAVGGRQDATQCQNWPNIGVRPKIELNSPSISFQGLFDFVPWLARIPAADGEGRVCLRAPGSVPKLCPLLCLNHQKARTGMSHTLVDLQCEVGRAHSHPVPSSAAPSTGLSRMMMLSMAVSLFSSTRMCA
jgi:hypothetical protein